MDETRLYQVYKFGTTKLVFATESFEELKKKFKRYYLGKKYIVNVDYYTDGKWVESDVLDWNNLLGKEVFV